MLGPMKLMMAPEFASTGELEMSWFQRLSLAKGRNPLRLAPCPVLMALHALWLLVPEPDPDPLPDPLPPPELELVPPDDNVEPGAPPPQFVHENANTSTARAAGKSFQENLMGLFSQGTAAKTARSQALPRRNRDMYHQHLVDGSNWKLSTCLKKGSQRIAGETAFFRQQPLAALPNSRASLTRPFHRRKILRQ